MSDGWMGASCFDPAVTLYPRSLMSPVPTLTAAGLGRGARIGLPFMASSVLYGLAFGLLANETGIAAAEAAAMSLVVFSGSAQVAIVQAWASHPGLLAVFLTVVVANVRYVLMVAALRSYLAPLGPLKATLALLPLVDGSFAIALRERARGDHDAGILLGSSLVSYVGWAVGTVAGAAAGRLVANPKAIGLDFVIVAFCAASAAMMAQGFRRLREICPAAAAMGAVVLCELLAPGPWTVVVAGLTAAIVAALMYRPAQRPLLDRREPKP